MEFYAVSEFLLHPLCGGKQLVHALFMHDAAHKQEANRPRLRVGLVRIVLQIDARAVQHHVAPLRYDPGRNEGIPVPGVLKKHDPRTFQRRSVKRQHEPPEPAAVFNGAAKARDVHGIGYPRHPAGKAAVDIGLNGISQDEIRPDLFQHGAVLPEQLSVTDGVHAAAVDGRIEKAAAVPHQLRDKIAVWERNIHLVPRVQECQQ